MMTPLQNEQRRQGGNTRADNQSKPDRSFLATLAASRRPLLHDVKMTDEELLSEFRRLSSDGPNGRPWLRLLIVGKDGRTIRRELDNATILKRLKTVGGAIGFMGVTIFGSPNPDSRAPSLQVYYKPLKKGTEVVEKLKQVSTAVMESLIPRIQSVEGKLGTDVE
jgi:hypothetical protein